MNKQAPKITVLMSVYNGERYLRESVDSILTQTYADFEFIIIDDGSTDNTPSIIEEYAAKDKRIINMKNNQRIHLTKSLNLGLKKARGVYIARQDADDISLPERLNIQIEYMEKNVEVGILGTSAEYIDGIGNPIKISLKQTNRDLISWELLFHNPLIHSSVIFKSDLVRSLGGYDEEFLRSQDYALWSKCSSFTVVDKLPNILLKHRTRYKPMHNIVAIEQITSSVAIMHKNIETLLKDTIPIKNVHLLRRIKISPLKTIDDYHVVFNLLNRIQTTFMATNKLDKTTLQLIQTYSNSMVNKWKGFPTYNFRLPKLLMYMQTIFIYWLENQSQRQNLFGKIIRISSRNDKIGKYLGLFSLRYWNIE